MPRDQVFISYSHEDTKWREDLEKHLKPYLRAGSIKGWSDEQIVPGSKWFGEIKSALVQTNVAVLLVSPDFLASEFIHEHELGPLLKEAERGGVTILWVPIYASAYKQTALEKYQAVLDPDKPLGSFSKAKRDEAWVRICEEIEKAVHPTPNIVTSTPSTPPTPSTKPTPDRFVYFDDDFKMVLAAADNCFAQWKGKTIDRLTTDEERFEATHTIAGFEWAELNFSSAGCGYLAEIEHLTDSESNGIYEALLNRLQPLLASPWSMEKGYLDSDGKPDDPFHMRETEWKLTRHSRIVRIIDVRRFLNGGKGTDWHVYLEIAKTNI